MINISRNSKGFTLIELAIVLIIIGLILGMVFKGRQLIENAKVKSLASQYNKIYTAALTFYDRYGFWPGDGCRSATPSSVSDCNRSKDGKLQTPNEKRAFFHLLVNVYGLLSASDIKSSVGGYWFISYSTIGSGSNRKPGNWLYLVNTNPLDGNPTSGFNIEAKYVCALDKSVDDGKSDTGDIRLSGGSLNYDTNTDCWSLNSTTTQERLFMF